MDEPLALRSVADLEELEALPDSAKILIIDAGTAKQISKSNAKFGGGSVTIFDVVQNGSVPN
nr:MAG TPA: hypothetical protein [Caudoviricetes sp.]